MTDQNLSAWRMYLAGNSFGLIWFYEMSFASDQQRGISEEALNI